jgi:hypothetical protein
MANFTSKQGNYRVVLKPGQPPEPLTGRVGIGSISVRFVDGKAIIDDNKVVNYGDKEFNLVELMKKHPSFNIDFVADDGNSKDPWEDNRAESEPQHDVLNIKHGEITENVNPAPKLSLTKEKQRLMKEAAQDMATKLLQEMLSDPKTLKKIISKLPKQEQEEVNEIVQPNEPAQPVVIETTEVSKE